MSMIRRRLMQSVLVVLLLAPCALADCAEEPKTYYDDFPRVGFTRIPEEVVPGWMGLAHRTRDVDGKEFGCFNIYPVAKSSEWVDAWKTGYSLSLTAEVDYRFPLFGHIYSMAGGNKEPPTVGLIRVEEQGLLDKLLKNRDSYILHFGGGAMLHGCQLRLTTIDSKSATMFIDAKYIYEKDKEPQVDLTRSKALTLKVDDVFDLKAHKFKVVNLVPADSKNRLTGWMEILPVEPLKKEEKPRD